MLGRIKKIIAVWNDHQEIDAMAQRELEELGLTRTQLHQLAAMPAVLSDRVAAMAAIFGVSAQDLQLQRGDYVQILEKCRHCHAGRECAHILSKRGAVPAEAAFCPNAETFAAAAAV